MSNPSGAPASAARFGRSMDGRPAPAGAIAPTLDRSKAILWLGGTLIGVNFVIKNHLDIGELVTNVWAPDPPGESLVDVAFQLVMLGGLYLASRISDLAGTAAVVFLVAVWLAFLYSHATPVEGFLHAGASTQSTAAHVVVTDKTQPSKGSQQ